MIAVVERPNRFCAVRWVGRVRLAVKILTYCDEQLDAGSGVMQVPDRLFSGKNETVIGIASRTQMPGCARCKQLMI